MNLIKWLDQRKHWWKAFMLIFTVSIAVVGYIGYKTYQFAPPIADFTDKQGKLVFSSRSITDGQQVFFRYGLMDYGSYLGDGGLRGPDFTAEALNRTATWMNDYYAQKWEQKIPNERLREHAVRSLVQEDLKENRYNSTMNAVTLNDAQVYAFEKLVQYYEEKFGEGGELAGDEAFKPANYITDPEEIKDLTAFFFWGGWLCAAKRPGFDYSFTHNWPYDPLAGNIPTAGVTFWSVIGALALVLSMGIVFYFYGKMDRETFSKNQQAQLAKTAPMATSELVEHSRPTTTQRACYKFFAIAAVLFLVQILAGIFTINDFVGLFAYLGVQIDEFLPVTVMRAWHSQISILWIAVCWFAGTIWILPLICHPEPPGQLPWINTLFWMLVVVITGTTLGIPLGVKGLLGDYWRWLGIQGWEFMQLGRFYQYVLFAAFVVWPIIIVRGVWPVLKQKQTWSLPNWMVYSIAGIIFMFTTGFVAEPDTNFVIADFWRWCTVHMWIEAFFELFTTIIVAYFLYIMGFVSHMVAARVVYLAAVLFLGSGLIGISHNFYWNAKSIETVALGGVFSSLQIVPLILLTVEAWRFRQMPDSNANRLRYDGENSKTFGLVEPFMYLVAVNFWNFMGAGVFGFMINLPIINYYQHGTYLTINIAFMLFCGRWIIGADRWSPGLLRFSFWSLNIGLALMVIMDLFPVGIHQLIVAMTEGYAYARSQAYIYGQWFQILTWLRGIGVAIFVVGGVFPLVWFMVSRSFSLKAVQPTEETFVVPPTALGVASKPPAAEQHERDEGGHLQK
jgi:nitric oxide reductase subunit B